MTNMDWCGTGQLVEEMRKEREDPFCVHDLDVVKEFFDKEGNPPEGEWRPKDGNPFILEWHGIGEMMAEAVSQNASQTHDVALQSIKTTPPYPPYGLDNLEAPRATSEEKA